VLACVPALALVSPGAVEGFGGRALAVTAVGLTAALMVHHDREVLCTPALANTVGGAERRALVALATLLVGPVLIGADLLLGLEASLTFVAISTTTLSGSVALHVFRQLRRWGALQHDIHHDGLTGLPNREYFGERLERAIELARVEQHIIALLFLDLDRFKNVNDSLGHSAGNELLIEVARRLRSSIEGSATVARLSGDEFAVLVPHVRTFRHTEAIGKAILGVFAEPFKVGGREIFVTPSIGAAHYPTDGVTPSELLEHADHAMYRAKERGRNNVQLYDSGPAADTGQPAKHSRLDLESALHRALDERQLSLLYQPQIDVLHNAMTGVEALLRWDHPILGPVPPGDFIAVAEESGLIDQLGEWVLLEACTQARRWQATSGFDISVAVNPSPRQFQTQRVQDLVARVLRMTELDPRLLELELTESLAVQDSEQLKEVMAEVRAMGVRCAVDDFGMGYSGLDYLGRFRFDVVKIDRSFVTRIDDTGAPIVTAVIAMAKGLGMTVVAEGVETAEQAEFLRRHGCDVMQGYFFSKPLSAMQIDQVLARLRAARPLPTSDRVVATPLPEEARKPQLFGRAAG
jgi:diguanylate cyclase (GGDEF)-like protein